jgi:hypothetical protein
MPELLLELFSEEIPARMQARAADDLKRLVTDALKAAGLAHGDARAYVTPRRLTLVVDDLPEQQPDLREEKRGPRADAPDKAIDGFLKANGLTRDQCEERDLDKGTFLFAVMEKSGDETAAVLPGLLAAAIADLPWPKSMRWGDGDMRWVRTLERVLCRFGGEVLTLTLRNDVVCGDMTSGHRFLAPKPFAVTDFADYANKLRHAFVILDRDERKAHIAEHAEKIAKAEKLTLRDDPGLLDEVTGLVEWPVVMIASWSLPIPRRRTAVSPSWQATSACSARGCRTPSSSGIRTARSRLKAVSRTSPTAYFTRSSVPWRRRSNGSRRLPATWRRLFPAAMPVRRCAPRALPRPIWSPRWSMNSPNFRASWAVTTR